jgi:hypothetical protein
MNSGSALASAGQHDDVQVNLVACLVARFSKTLKGRSRRPPDVIAGAGSTVGETGRSGFEQPPEEV